MHCNTLRAAESLLKCERMMIFEDSEYEVHAIRYGRHSDRKVSDNFIPPFAGSPDLHNSSMPMDFFVWIVRNEARTIVVDTGFGPAAAAARERELVFPVEQGLAALGVRAEDVRDVILTHMHWDHAGNNDLFPHARFHLQAGEMQFCTGPCMCHKALRVPYSAADVAAMVRHVYAGRVQFHEGEAEIAPGISVHLVGGHSRGLQIVRVKTRRGWVVLASDASHYYANLEQGRPFPLVDNVAAMLDGFNTISRLASSPKHYVPGHDPLVLERYEPSISPSLPHIVRLDIDPNG